MIREVQIRARNVFGIIGRKLSSSEELVFLRRNFAVEQLTASTEFGIPFTARFAGIVFLQDLKKPLRMLDLLRKSAGICLDHGAMVYAFTGSSEAPVINTLKNAGIPTYVEGEAEKELSPYAYILKRRQVGKATLLDSLNQVLDETLEFPPGAPANGALEIEGEVNIQEDEILFRQAFALFSNISVRRLGGGRSGAGVYVIHAKMDSESVPRPFVAKLDTRARIAHEYKQNVLHLEKITPFYLFPKPKREMCQLGTRNGILVSDFVGESESLLDCAMSDRAMQVLSCLFDRTLPGLYGTSNEVEYSFENLKSSVSIDTIRLAVAKQLGLTMTPDQLLEGLRAVPHSSRILHGSIHGDLNATNVLARTGEAVIIDFFTVTNGPLLLDFAALEASLLVDGENKVADLDVDSWTTSVLPLYSGRPILEPRRDPEDRRVAWLFRAVNKIRLHAGPLDFGRNHYAIVLAAYLTYKASKEPDSPSGRQPRRAACLVFAERLLLSLQNSALGGDRGNH